MEEDVEEEQRVEDEQGIGNLSANPAALRAIIRALLFCTAASIVKQPNSTKDPTMQTQRKTENSIE